MIYENKIREAFTTLGFEPRPGQIEAVDQIVNAFVDDKIPFVILNAPTGSGKSIIGAVAAEIVHNIKYPDMFERASFMLTGTNALATQYNKTFATTEDSMTFRQIKGANNYICNALLGPENEEIPTAEQCAIRLFEKDNDLRPLLKEHCNSCVFNKNKNERDYVRHLVTNYSFFFIQRMYLEDHGVKSRTLTIWDEAHLVNDLFADHNAIFFSKNRLSTYLDDAINKLKTTDVHTINAIRRVRDDLTAGLITERNYMQYLTVLFDVYKRLSDLAKTLATNNVKDFNLYAKYLRLSNKYFGLGCKIGDLHRYKYPHVMEYKQKDHEVSVKPVFVSEMFNQLLHSEHDLFMSATISPEYLEQTLGLEKKDYRFIQLPPTFQPENKKVIFFSPLNLNYNTLKENKTVTELTDKVNKIVNKHTKVNECGIILAPSFELTQKIADVLIWNKNFELYEHKRGEKLSLILDGFKRHSGSSPAVLVSPSLFEGIDLPGELSRFQILVKAPFGSLGDKRVKYLLDHHPDIYSLLTIMKMVQGLGRSVRSPEDYATSYILDLNCSRLWKSPLNVWKDEFNVSYTQFLL